MEEINQNNIFIGREKEINQFLENLNKEKSTIVIIGELGIGKSVLLEQFHKILCNTFSIIFCKSFTFLKFPLEFLEYQE